MRALYYAHPFPPARIQVLSPEADSKVQVSLEDFIIQRVTFTLTLKDMLLQNWMILRTGMIAFNVAAVLAILSQLFEQPIQDFLQTHLPPLFAHFLSLMLPVFRLACIGGWIGIFISFTIVFSVIYMTHKNSYQNIYVQITETGAEYGSPDFKFYFDWSQVKQVSQNSHIFSIQARHTMARAFMIIPRRGILSGGIGVLSKEAYPYLDPRRLL